MLVRILGEHAKSVSMMNKVQAIKPALEVILLVYIVLGVGWLAWLDIAGNG